MVRWKEYGSPLVANIKVLFSTAQIPLALGQSGAKVNGRNGSHWVSIRWGCIPHYLSSSCLGNLLSDHFLIKVKHSYTRDIKGTEIHVLNRGGFDKNKGRKVEIL
jgi:hypothetical protein